MKNLKGIRKLSLLAFILLLAITAVVIVFGSQWSNLTNNKTVSQPGTMPDGVSYEMTPMPKASLPAPVYPQGKSDANLKVRKSIVDLTRSKKS